MRMAKIKILAAIILAAVLLAAAIVYLCRPPEFLEVYFLDVGQGDAELIKAPSGQVILIDGGPDNKVLSELGKVLPWHERKIDLMILSHPHDDHDAGQIDVLKRYSVGMVLAGRATSSSPAWSDWRAAAAGRETVLGVERQKIVLAPDCYLEIFQPPLAKDLNESSLLVFLVYRNNKFLFTGDMGQKTEERLLAEGVDVAADVLKISHHGSDGASSEVFLRAVDPRLAVIEVGSGNKFSFPAASVLRHLSSLGARVWRTDIDGTVRILSDGEKVWRR